MRTTPLPAWPQFTADAAAGVADAVLAGLAGDAGHSFEREYAAAVGTTYAVALANGTLALELALRAVGVGPGDEVVVPARTSVASAAAVLAVGARPVFADVDPDSGGLTAATIADLLGPATRAVVAVHLGGWPIDMDPLLQLVREHGLSVVEDCAQAHGARYRGRPVGGIGDAGAWSFCNDKILSTGEGGMVTTDDPAIFRAVWSYKDHGRAPDEPVGPARSGFRWVHQTAGSNARMHELAAVLGRSGLDRLPDTTATRRGNAAALLGRLAAEPALRVPLPPPEVEAGWYRAYVYLRPELLRPGWDRDRVLSAVLAEGVPVSSGSCGEVYLERSFPPALRPAARLPVARALAESALAFPVHPGLAPADLADIAAATEKVLSVARAV